MEKNSIQYSVFSLLFIFSYFLFPISQVEAKLTNFGGPLGWITVPCVCPIPSLYYLICDERGYPLPLLMTGGVDLNLNYNFFTPGTMQLGTYTPLPGYCGKINEVTGICEPNYLAVIPTTIGTVTFGDTVGTGAYPGGACVESFLGTAAAGGGAAGAAGAGAAGAAATDPLAPTDPINTATDPNTAFPNEPGTDFNTGTDSTTAFGSNTDLRNGRIDGLVNNNNFRVNSNNNNRTAVTSLQNELRTGSGPAARALNTALTNDPSAFGNYGRLTQNALNEQRNSRNFNTGSSNLGNPVVRPNTTPSNTTSNSNNNSSAFINAYNNYLSLNTPTLGNSSNIGSAGAAILNPGTSFNTGTNIGTGFLNTGNTTFYTGYDPANNIVNGNTTNFNTGTAQVRPYSYIPTAHEQRVQDTVNVRNYIDGLVSGHGLVGPVRTSDVGYTNAATVVQNYLMSEGTGPAAQALRDAIARNPSAYGTFGPASQAALNEYRNESSTFIASCNGNSCSGPGYGGGLLKAPGGGVVNAANSGLTLTKASDSLRVTHFGGATDVRKTPEGYALTKKGDVTEGMKLGDKYEEQFGGDVKWYYALDSNGEKIKLPDNVGTRGGGVSYNEAGSPFTGNALRGVPLRQIDPNGFYMAYPIDRVVSGIPRLPSKGIDLTGASGLIRMKDGTYINLPFVDRGPIKGGTIDVSPGAYDYIEAHGGIDAITTVRTNPDGTFVNVSRNDLLKK